LPLSARHLSSPVYANRGPQRVSPTFPPVATCPIAAADTAATSSARSSPISPVCRAAPTGALDGPSIRPSHRQIWRPISCQVRSGLPRSVPQFSVPPFAHRRHSSQANGLTTCTWLTAWHTCDALGKRTTTFGAHRRGGAGRPHQYRGRSLSPQIREAPLCLHLRSGEA